MVAKKKSESETIDRDEFSTRFNWERFRGQLDSVWECCCNFATGWGGRNFSEFCRPLPKKKKKKKLGILKLTYKFWRCYSFWYKLHYHFCYFCYWYRLHYHFSHSGRLIQTSIHYKHTNTRIFFSVFLFYFFKKKNKKKTIFGQISRCLQISNSVCCCCCLLWFWFWFVCCDFKARYRSTL